MSSRFFFFLITFLFMLSACTAEPRTAVSPTPPAAIATTIPASAVAPTAPGTTARETVPLQTATAVPPPATVNTDEVTATPQSLMPLPVREGVTFTLATQLGGIVNAVALDGNVVYAGIGPRLVTIDISDPAALRFLWQSDVLSGVVHAVAVHNSIAYVVAGRFDLHLYDVHDPANPVAISALAGLGGPQTPIYAGLVDIFLSGNTAYILHRVYSGDSGVTAVDITDPAQPMVIGMRSLSYNAAIAVDGNVLYIADEGRLYLVDAANLDRTLSEIGLSGNDRYFVAVLNDIAYVIENHLHDPDPFFLFDVSNPAQPVEIVADHIEIGFSISEMKATGGWLFLVGQPWPHAGCPANLYVINISDTASPGQPAEFNPQSCVKDIALAGDTLVTASSNKLQIFDVDDPARLTVSGEFFPSAGFSYVDAIALNDNVAYIISGNPAGPESGLLRLLDLSRPAAPKLTGDGLDLSSQYDIGGSGLFVRGNRLFHRSSATLIATDISQPTTPRLIMPGEETVTFWGAAPAMMGNILYGQVDGGLGIVDMSDPANPVLVNTIPTETVFYTGMSVSGSYLIVTSQDGRAPLRLYDISDALKPAEIGRLELLARFFTVVGDTVYAMVGEGLSAVDISNPVQPAEIGRFALPFSVSEMVSAGELVYLSTDDGIWALDVSDKARPYLAGRLPFSGTLNVGGDLLYVAAGDAGLVIASVPTSGACRNDSEFVRDVNVPDRTHFGPGTSFTKTWRLRNSGTCTWDDSYRLNFVSGERVDGLESMALDEVVLPGDEVDISVGLTAPLADGTYRGQWQLVAPDGTPFGVKPYVEIVVP